jgi:NH3-dependent NAD+ synthetase
MDLATKLIQRLLRSEGYQGVAYTIIDTIIEHLEDEHMKMESLFEDENYEATKEDHKKYNDLTDVLAILEEHRDTMAVIMRMADEREKEIIKENKENENLKLEMD